MSNRAEKKTVFLALILSLFFSSMLAKAQVEYSGPDVLFFYSTTCPHCAHEKEFLERLQEKYPGLKVNYIIAAENKELYEETCRRYNTTPSGVPRTFIGELVFVGYVEADCNLVWYESYGGYLGCPRQIENQIRRIMNLSTLISEADAVEITRKSALVTNLTKNHDEVVTNVFFLDGLYLVAWWTPERIKSNLDYPDLLIKVNPHTGEIVEETKPIKWIPGVLKPSLSETNPILLFLILLFFVLVVSYMLVGGRIQQKYWLSAFIFLVIALLFVYSKSLSPMDVVTYAKNNPFPIFTFVIALIDGFNPCAFAVLVFLLSLLTYTKSRKRMIIIGTVFILTSGFMYFLFIFVLLFFRIELLYQYKDSIRMIVASIALVAGVINIKDFFFFKQGISLTLSSKKQNKIFTKAGKLIRQLQEVESVQELFFTLLGTIMLAAMVNLVELGCTFILPMEYIEALIVNYPKDYLLYILFTTFYSFVYIMPLFLILGSFVYTFTSNRLSETHGRILKLVGGLLMFSLGILLLFRPELLVFG